LEVWFFYLPQAEFEAVIANPDHCRCFAHLTIEHLEDALRVIASLMPNDVVARVAGRLLCLSIVEAGAGSEITVTQSDLASMCGLSRQSVNKALRRLIEEGAVSSRYGKSLLVMVMRYLLEQRDIVPFAPFLAAKCGRAGDPRSPPSGHLH
jgi:CRP-like cAMP-binding protein